jgi:FkbM family methyltransferase
MAADLAAGGITSAVKQTLRRAGFDVVRFPHANSPGAHLRELIRSLQIDCVLDVGAHVGEYGRLLRSVGYAGLIVSFEPASASFRAVARLAAHDALWTAHCTALGNRDERRTLNIACKSELSSFRTPTGEKLAEWDGLATAAQEVVEVRRLDGIFERVVPDSDTRRVFLKLDTQGSDLEVLDGAEGCLRRVHAIQVEMALRPVYEDVPDFGEALATLIRLGFEPTGFFPVARDPLLRLIEVDCVLRRGEPVAALPTREA